MTRDPVHLLVLMLPYTAVWVGAVVGHAVMGIALYAMAFTLPLFLQGNLRVTADQTRMFMLYRILASVCRRRRFGGGRFRGWIELAVQPTRRARAHWLLHHRRRGR